MLSIVVRNVNQALSMGMDLLDTQGIERNSRYGPVLYVGEVSTTYVKPYERVLLNPIRDANPFFHLYESLWMLAGRNDVEGPARYAQRMRTFSDDGTTFHGAYGFRWRNHFGMDQLGIIARTLRENPEDRRCVLQMWDVSVDLGMQGKDFPCNTIASFQRGVSGELNLTVFCRSNDVIWGAYGANAVQFSMLLEYMAQWIQCPIGTYTQVSVNYHAYVDVFNKMKEIPRYYSVMEDPYVNGDIYAVPMTAHNVTHEQLDNSIHYLLEQADNGFTKNRLPRVLMTPWMDMAFDVLYAHHLFKFGRHLDALAVLRGKADWTVAACQWLERRINANPKQA